MIWEGLVGFAIGFLAGVATLLEYIRRYHIIEPQKKESE